jgi:GT2 family glycosyltransferase/SAM-dependent methyltransferase
VDRDLERFIPTLRGQIAYEHFHRYALARDFVAGMRVLDVASGEGYGTWILSRSAGEVVGVDIDPQTVDTARQRYEEPNRISFQTGDCAALPFEASTFDVVVSFETIEHIADAAALLREAKRVLKPDGLLIVSTPNREIYNKNKPPNHFHTHEFSCDEFRDLLRGQFARVELRGQRMAVVSTISTIGAPGAEVNSPSWRGYTVTPRGDDPDAGTGVIDLRDAEYIVAFCSDMAIARPVEMHSIFVREDDDLWMAQADVISWASKMHDTREAVQEEIQRLAAKRDAAAAEGEISRVELAKSDLDERRAELQSAATASALVSFGANAAGLVLERGVEPSGSDYAAAMAEVVAKNAGAKAEIARLKSEADRLATAVNHLAAMAGAQVQDPNLALIEIGRAFESRARLESRNGQLERELGEAIASSHAAAQRARTLEDEVRQALEVQASAAEAASSAKVELEQALSKATAEIQRVESARATELIRIESFEGALRAARSECESSGRERASLTERIAVVEREALELERVARDSARVVRQQHDYGEAQRRALEVARSTQAGLAEQIGPGVLSVTPALRGAALALPVGQLVRLGDSANRAREWRTAEIYYAAALRKKPSRGAIWIQYGHALKEQGKVALAEIAYRRASSLAPHDPDPPFQLARALTILGRIAEAREHFERTLRMDPANGHARAEMDRLPAPATSPAVSAGERSTPVASGDDLAARRATSWPPTSVDNYWLPQGLRNYIFDRFGEHLIPLYQYLMSVVDRLSSDQAIFETSEEIDILSARSRHLASIHYSREPDVSIVIPVFNNLCLTLTSIVSILENVGSTAIEIIIGDDASTDATRGTVGAIGGCVRLVRHETNRGFLHNCNQTAAHARGRIIVLLNNDTLVMPGWLEGLCQPLTADPKIGFTGSKLLNGDGTLQEAGGILWRDGSAWNFGRGGDPRAPEFNYLKDVDYVSGASIALRAETWQALGGFDPHFAPAYCEDSDLAFRVRAQGLRVVYAPASEVIHHEGRSHGRDVASGHKAHQVINNAKFLERWKSVLNAEHFDNGTNVLTARDRSGQKPHILVIDHYVPEYDRDAGSRTMMAFLRVFVDAGFQVSFWPDNLHRSPAYTEVLQAMGIEVIYGPSFVDKFDDWLSDRASVLKYVLLSRPHIAPRYLDALEYYPEIFTLYYGHDLHFKRLEQQYELSGDPGLVMEIEKVRAQELDICRRVSVPLYPTEPEVECLRGLLGPRTKAMAVPAYVFDHTRLARAATRTYLQERGQPETLLFVGGFAHGPNADGVIWLVNEVMPIIARGRASPVLQVVGSGAPREVAELAGEHVRIVGRVSDEDLEALYARASVAVAPLRYGGGIKGKVIEAMAHGVPLATTSVGAQGIAAADDLSFVGDDPEAFAAAVVQALDDRREAERRAARALAFIGANYTPAAIRRVLGSVMPELADPQ